MQNLTTLKIFAAAVVTVSGMAALAPSAEAATAYALNDENGLLSFDTATPSDVTGVGQIQLLSGDPIQDLIGIDFRPSNGLLYGVGRGRSIYTINPATAIATQVGTILPDPADTTAPIPGNPLLLNGTRFGFDFNPVPDNNQASPPSLRIISDNGQNLRTDADTGLTQQDVSLVSSANIVGAAYTNSNAGPTTELDLNGAATTLYGIDSVTNQLVRFTNPNAGTFVLQGGGLGVNASNLMGFDIFFDGATNTAYSAIQDAANGVSQLYTINLTSGLATVVDIIGGGDTIDGLTIVPEPASLGLIGLAATGLLARRRRN